MALSFILQLAKTQLLQAFLEWHGWFVLFMFAGLRTNGGQQYHWFSPSHQHQEKCDEHVSSARS